MRVCGSVGGEGEVGCTFSCKRSTLGFWRCAAVETTSSDEEEVGATTQMHARTHLSHQCVCDPEVLTPLRDSSVTY